MATHIFPEAALQHAEQFLALFRRQFLFRFIALHRRVVMHYAVYLCQFRWLETDPKQFDWVELVVCGRYRSTVRQIGAIFEGTPDARFVIRLQLLKITFQSDVSPV